MLGKLLKYEWKYSMRFLIPVNCVLLLLAFLGRISISNNFLEDVPLFAMLTLMFYVLGIIMVSLFTYIYIAYRFYRNLFTDEGYLTFTLPSKPSTLLLSKLINAFLWTLINVLVICISVLVLVGQTDLWNELIKVWPEISKELSAYFNFNIFTFTVYAIIYIFISIVSSIVKIYASIAIGHTFGKHKVASSLITYIVLSIVISIISNILNLVFGYADITSTILVSDTGTFGTNLIKSTNFTLAFTALYTIILYFIASHIMTKKINLE